ncbi:MAG TPA: copper resistance protein CopC [Acidimicrobiales bacterium]|nr:copper resistance protein CopC [Acidimicrobiales bacterium]
MKRLATIVGTALFLLQWSAPAGAHAELRDSDPSASARLDRSPGRVVVRFTEEVELSAGGIRVFSSSARRVERGRPYHPDGHRDEAAVALPELDPGAYVVTWRVLSEDSHPIRGAFTFQFDSDDDATTLAARLLQEGGGDPLVAALSGIARATLFASLLVLLGGVAFLMWVWPDGRSDPRARRVIGAAFAASAVATLAGVTLQGASAAGLPLSAAVKREVLAEVLSTRYGHAAAVRLAGLVVFGLLFASLVRRGDSRPSTRLRTALLGVSGLAVLGTVVAAGHAISGRWVAWAVAMDLVHLAAGAIWIGGLAVMATALLRSGASPQVPRLVARFSRVAITCVGLLLATGSVQALRQVESLEAATSTFYGRLLLIKVGAFVALVTLATRSRAWSKRNSGDRQEVGVQGDIAGDITTLRRSVALETAAAVVVLAVTALLVNAVPGRIAVAVPYSAELRAGTDLLIDLTVDPAKAGPLDIHLYTLTGAGLPASAEEVSAQLSLRDTIGPIDVPLSRAGPNHFAAYGFAVPIAGKWRLEVAVVTSGVVVQRATAVIPIR